MGAVTSLLGNLRLAGGDDPAAFDRALYILESLASVRSAVILSEMACPQDVALVAGCCAVEVLRIYAPTPPYNAAELKVRRPAK